MRSLHGGVAAAAVAAVVFFAVATLPPPAERLGALGDPELERRTVAGAVHIHTTRSDGTADVNTIAGAAARAGLKFVILADHGDATREPAPPSYIDGVLCLDGVEISTNSGHYVALDMKRSAYPLGGDASSVVEDVARLGGFGIAAHPDSPKPALRWREGGLPIDGIEWLNADSEWRDETRLRVARALADYLVRPAAALASLLDRPVATLARWDAMTRERPVVGIVGHDAHGGIGGAVEDEGRRWLVLVPSYEAAFRSMSTRVILDEPLSGDASSDARLVMSALRGGRVFTAIDAVAGPAVLDFRVRANGRDWMMGESVPPRPATSFTAGMRALAIARASVPAGAQIVLLHDGAEIAAVDGGSLEHAVARPGAYRVEVRTPRAPGTPPIPWIVSNPIYLRSTASLAPFVPPLPEVVLPLDAASWHVEHDPASKGTLSRVGGAPRLEYSLLAGERASQFVALAAELPPGLPAFDSVVFTGAASAPMRVSVQLRFRGRGDRWVRSVYLSPEPRAVHVRISDLVPAGSGGATRPDVREATALLFVVDLTNAAPGASGWFDISGPALAAQTAGQPVNP